MSKYAANALVDKETSVIPPHLGINPKLSETDMAERLVVLSGLSADQLRREWQRLYRTSPPKRMTHDLLLLAVAWKMQEKAYGGLSAASKRKLTELGKELSVTGSLVDSRAIQLKPGAKIVREWNGKPHEVIVREDGFEWNGNVYGSLSKIATEITGAHWSGPRFFGLKPRPRPFASADGTNHE